MDKFDYSRPRPRRETPDWTCGLMLLGAVLAYFAAAAIIGGEDPWRDRGLTPPAESAE